MINQAGPIQETFPPGLSSTHNLVRTSQHKSDHV